MAEPNGRITNPSLKKMRKKRPKTRVERLKLKEVRLRNELKTTLKDIMIDTKKRGKEDSLTIGERQKLANYSTVIRSKILRLQDEIETRTYVKDDRTSKHIRSKIENRYAMAARKHNRLLRMTAELEKMKEDEEAIREIALNDDLGLKTRREKTERGVDRSLVQHRKTQADMSRISQTRFGHLTTELEYEANNKEVRLESVCELLSKLGVETTQGKLEKAEGLEQKYDMTKEMRDLIHGQMISRPHKNSYWRINPPYRRKRKEVVHVRKSYVRNFYENRMDMVTAKDIAALSPRKETIEKPKSEELTRFQMTSGRSISMNKMKDYTPPGMVLTPADC